MTDLTLQPGHRRLVRRGPKPASGGWIDDPVVSLNSGDKVTLTAGTVPAPTPAPSGWVSVHRNDFTTWDPSKYVLYQASWPDTDEQIKAGAGGFYTPSNITSDGSKLRIRLHTDSTGIPRVAAFVVRPDGATETDL